MCFLQCQCFYFDLIIELQDLIILWPEFHTTPVHFFLDFQPFDQALILVIHIILFNVLYILARHVNLEFNHQVKTTTLHTFDISTEDMHSSNISLKSNLKILILFHNVQLFLKHIPIWFRVHNNDLLWS